MDGDDEPTELTAMTGESSSTTPDCSGNGDTLSEEDEGITSWDHSSAFIKDLVQSPKGICITACIASAGIVFLAFLMSKIVIGSVHLGACSLEPFVPIYLVSSGAIFLAFMLSLMLVCIKCRHRGEEDERVSPIHLLVLSYFFIHLVLQLAGSVCVIRARNDLQDLQNKGGLSTNSGDGVSPHTVQLFAPEVTPAYPLVEPVVIDSDPVVPRRVHHSRPTCSGDFLTYAFGAVVFELILSGLFFIIVVASLCDLTYLECLEPTTTVKKAKMKNNVGDIVTYA